MSGVSVLIPVHNAGSALLDTLRAVLNQRTPHLTLDIILVDDGSQDGAVADAVSRLTDVQMTVLRTECVGASAALNAGLTHVRHPFVAQVDQDVVLHGEWLTRLLAGFDAPDVGAVQGQYVTDERAGFFARVMGRDLQERYAAIADDTTHVCTGNTVYRTDALRAVGGFDEAMGYGYDNDVSYRLRRAGFRLRYCGEAQSTHRWRDGLLGYLQQQYGFGYGRLDVVLKHRDHAGGDSVSPTFMMLHPIVLAIALCAAVAATLRTWSGVEGMLAVVLIALLMGERAVAGVRAAWRFRDWTPLAFPVVHLLRDAAWVAAIGVWALRRLAGAAMLPRHSMTARPVESRESALAD